MNLSEIELAVKREIEDYSVEFFTDIPAVINEIYIEACEEIDPGVPNLEDMESAGTVLNKAVMNQPAQSSGKVIAVYDSNGHKLTRVNGDLATLRDKCGSLTRVGAVEYWLPLGQRIWYAPIPPAAENLEIIYYKNPTELTGDADEPSEIPGHLHRGILVHGTAFRLFSRIEQEGENEALETAKQFTLFTAAMDQFKTWVARRQRVKGRTAWDA